MVRSPDGRLHRRPVRPAAQRAARLAAHHRSRRPRRRVDGRLGDRRRSPADIRSACARSSSSIRWRRRRRARRRRSRRACAACRSSARTSLANDGRSEDGGRPGERLRQPEPVSRLGRSLPSADSLSRIRPCAAVDAPRAVARRSGFGVSYGRPRVDSRAARLGNGGQPFRSRATRACAPRSRAPSFIRSTAPAICRFSSRPVSRIR